MELKKNSWAVETTKPKKNRKTQIDHGHFRRGYSVKNYHVLNFTGQNNYI